MVTCGRSDKNRVERIRITAIYARPYRQHESLKRRHYEQHVREYERGSFTPLVFSATGGMAPAATIAYKRLAYISWQTSASRTIARRSAGSGAQSVFLW